MIYWDFTKTNKNKAHSGLNRVSRCLLERMKARGIEVQPCRWSFRRYSFVELRENGKRIDFQPGDTWITPEVFAEIDRPGFENWLHRKEARTVVIYHDAIPLKYPEFTWPKSVSRHPHYMKLILQFDQILANSEASKQELLDYWQWAGVTNIPSVETIPLGADGLVPQRITTPRTLSESPHILMTGILEPRKNQSLLLDAALILKEREINFQISFVGRINPHFGKPIQERIQKLRRRGLPVSFFNQPPDSELMGLYDTADITVFPSLAEGNGLPVMESLWLGKPVICSPLACHREHAARGEGITLIDPMTPENLAGKISCLISDRREYTDAQQKAFEHKLPTWDDTVSAVSKIIWQS